MGNWIFLILLYLLFGWMKKKHQAKSRKEIEGQEDWDTETPPASRFGVLDEFLKPQAKSTKETESQEDWDTDTPPASGFGVLDEFLKRKGLMDEDEKPEEPIPQEKNEYLDSQPAVAMEDADDTDYAENIDRLDELETITEEIESFKDHILESRLASRHKSQPTHSVSTSINAVRMLNNPGTLKDAIIIKEILDKPRSLRRKIR